MTNPNGPYHPDFARISRAEQPRLRQRTPAIAEAVQNANSVLSKVAVTLNRAGSSKANPMLSGLGIELQFALDPNDRLIGVWVYQDRSNTGNSLLSTVSMLAPGLFAFYLQIGGGQIVAGSPALGAIKNFVRIRSEAGSVDKEFWAKTYDADVVQLEGQNCLDPETLLPVPYETYVISASRPWIELSIDFMVGWNDEFQLLHRRSDGDIEAGFLKAYGGAKFVSFFDTETAEEGVGVEVDPVTQTAIESQHKIRVQNTEGLKEITVRFRSKMDSDFFVDVPIQVLVVDPPGELCATPLGEPCSDVYFKPGDGIPEGSPGIASTPEVQVVEGTGTFPEELLVITMRGAIVGAEPKLKVTKWRYSTAAVALAGVKTIQVGAEETYLPLVDTASSPVGDPPYQDPNRLTIALSVNALREENIAYVIVQVDDNGHLSLPALVPGPRARDIQFTPLGGTGGGPICAY